MSKKQFKAESKKLLDMMINSIYTNPDIFLRELISNASDAIDKLYYRSLTEKDKKIKRDKLEIFVDTDSDKRIIRITDNGIGMTKEELEDNLGTIAKSGSELFKENNEQKKDISIIGQFGVGFYSSFMVASKVVVRSKSIDSDEAYRWESSGATGYTIDSDDKDTNGTEITLYLKEDTDNFNYSEYLDSYKLMNIIKKYSDYIRYPIKMNIKGEEDKVEEKVVNSMIPIWKKKQKDVKEEEYNDFYTDKFYDYEKPLKVIKSDVEGLTSYSALLFIPSHAPYNYYTKEYEKGLQLYSRGVLIMDKCEEIVPDYFSFVKGLVDSEDIALNISRETMQSNHQIKLIAKNIENKIQKELMNMLKDQRSDYEKFYESFGMQFKHGIYSSYGMNRDKLEDLLLFYSSKDSKYTTLSEYIERMKDDQKEIYYASGDSIDMIKMLPQVEMVLDKGYEVLYLTEYLDEFVIKMLGSYKEKQFKNVCDGGVDTLSDDEKKEIEKINTDNKELLDKIKDLLNGSVKEVKFTNSLNNHPVCLASSGELSTSMEKIINTMPNQGEKVSAETILEINYKHEISNKLKDLYHDGKMEELEKYGKILYNQARLISGLSVDNQSDITNIICELISK